MQASPSRAARLVLFAVLTLAAACSRAEPGPMPRSDAEVARVQRHLARVEAAMRAADGSHLDAGQRAARLVHLERLRRYREAGRFPHNHVPGPRRPVFIDSHGTRCAMAHLIESSGGGELVARIARERNGAYVRELAGEPELVDWLDESGISLAEAAAIQPTYGDQIKEEKVGRAFTLASMGSGVASGVAIGANLGGDAGTGAGWFGLLAGMGGMLLGGSVFVESSIEGVHSVELTMATVSLGAGLTAAWLGMRTLVRDDTETAPAALRSSARSVSVAPMAGLVNGLALQGRF
jgi:hypothetical protein